MTLAGAEIRVSAADERRVIAVEINKPARLFSGTVERRGENTMILTNIESVPGRTIVEHFGVVTGSTVRSKHFGRDFMAGLKNIVGGELKAYQVTLDPDRWEANGLFNGEGLSLTEARQTPAAGMENLFMEAIAQPA
mgnify:CR=1 FL=1